ncbi:HIT domain-containing protein [Kordiimonas aquimaris]|uniref:HIT domain-containing protein n=1 Tax=Kordiimonas aquimaris TaxID=707591 RepID=UPI0021D07C4E|nr:HIT family protein [Kordiimonas aquimaris]
MNETHQSFELHPQLAQDSAHVTMLSLCEVRLINDANYPWLLLVPQIAGIREIHQLSDANQQTLMHEITHVSKCCEAVTGADKMNVAALGNMVPQLHVHVIARFETDAAWPGPVWGVVPAIPYEQSRLDMFADKIKAALD